LYKKPEESVVKATPEPELLPKKDPVETFIEKLYSMMKSSKHFPNSLRDLEKYIKKNVAKKGDLGAQPGAMIVEDIKAFVESVLRRMNDKGMFTKKMRTGESKEHAKEQVKLKFADIIELFKREEKEDIPIVFESSFAFPVHKN
jgi:hypothetical protein